MTSKSKFTVESPHEYNAKDFLFTIEAGSKVFLEIKDKDKYEKEVLDNIRWIAQMVWDRPQFKREHFHSGLVGPKVHFRFPEPYDGGGLAWVEPVFPDEDPTNLAPNGYFFNSTGLPREVVKIEWREYQEDNLGPIITGEKLFGEVVQLHVYARGLYGHNIKVKLKDYNNINFDIEFENETDSKDYFTELIREVKLYKDASDPSKQLQKAVINIQLEPRWDYAGNYLEIGTTVSSNLSETFKSKDLYLKVRKPKENEKPKPSPFSKSGNKPTMVEGIPTDPAEFHPCRYEKIQITSNKEISASNTFDTRDIVIYDTSEKSNEIYLEPIEVTAGFKENLAEIEIKLENLDTEFCIFKGESNHEGKTLDITQLQGTEAWDGSGAVDNVSVGVDIGGVAKGDFQISGAKHAFGYRSHTNSSLKFQISYPYDVSSAFGLFKYFIPSTAKKHILNIPIKSCHKNDFPIIFHVYPDIKWTLKVAFNYERLNIPKIETTIVREEEYLSVYLPIPDAILEYVRVSEYFEQKVIFGKKMTVANIDFALTAQLDQEDDDHYSTEISLTVAIKTKIKKQLESLGVIGETLQKLFNGESIDGNEVKGQDAKKISKSDKKKLKKKLGDFTDDTIEEYIEGDISKKRLKKDTKKIRKKLKKKGLIVKKRDVVDVKIHWPSVGFTFSWSLSEGKTETARRKKLLHKTGYKLEAAFMAEPIIGMEAKLDFIALIAKAHPIATAVVLVIDATASLIGAEVDLYFQAEGDLFGEINGFLDTLTGENTFNAQALAETGEKVGRIGGRLKFILGGSVSAGTSFTIFTYTVSIEGEASIRAEAEASMAFALHANEHGFYLLPVFTFEGLIIIAQASVKVGIDTELEKSDEEDNDIKNEEAQDEDNDGSVEGSYQVIDRTIKKLDPIELYK